MESLQNLMPLWYLYHGAMKLRCFEKSKLSCCWFLFLVDQAYQIDRNQPGFWSQFCICLSHVLMLTLAHLNLRTTLIFIFKYHVWYTTPVIIMKLKAIFCLDAPRILTLRNLHQYICAVLFPSSIIHCIRTLPWFKLKWRIKINTTHLPPCWHYHEI